VKIGKGRCEKDGRDIAILSFGHPGNFATSAIRILRPEGIDPAHYDMRFVKPLDEELLHEVFNNFKAILTVEDGTVVGGFGSAILEFMAKHGYSANVRMLGIPDQIVEHGSPKQLHEECGFDANAIAEAAREMIKSQVNIKSLIQ
jgi:1-deoxy-D-xylulose-5-phosphate synthase